MASGMVKWFSPDKSFGFFQPQEGQKVSYDVVTERGKLAASNLKLG